MRPPDANNEARREILIWKRAGLMPCQLSPMKRRNVLLPLQYYIRFLSQASSLEYPDHKIICAPNQIMAKRNRDEVPNPNSVVNRDILQRLNFLYQASQLLGSIAPSPPRYASPKSLAGDAKKKTSMREQNKRRHPTTCADLSRSYVKSMKAIGQKTNVRMYVSD